MAPHRHPVEGPPNLPPPEAWPVPFEERRNAFLVVLGQARQCKLIDVHVAGEIVERVHEAINGELGHDA